MTNSSKHDKYGVQRSIVRQVQDAQDSIHMASMALELLRREHPEGLAGGWDADDLERLASFLNDALVDTGQFFFEVDACR